MTGFADTMENIGQPMGDEEVIGYILAGLGPGHNDIFTAITALSNEQKVTLPKVYSYLIAHEAQATSMNTTVEHTSSANNATRYEPNAPRCNKNNGHNNSNKRNKYRGGSGHGRGIKMAAVTIRKIFRHYNLFPLIKPVCISIFPLTFGLS
uniref:Uncharacterized protein n=1 Tax=Lactuca sativa TaxID=4236 RepID=A0A9R1X5L6_LACSA|nr:hypothetical protein LSAT_V11C600317650 [Lactuca sativa]